MVSSRSVGIKASLRRMRSSPAWLIPHSCLGEPHGPVVVKGATKRIRKPRSLNVEQFQKLIAFLKTPFNTMALVSVCLGLRVSELLALSAGT